MGIIIRQSAKASIVLILSAVIGSINVLWLSTAFLTPEQLGLSRFLLETSLMFAAFAGLGTPHIAVRFFSHFQDEKNKHRGFLFNLIFIGFIGFLIFSILFFFCKNLLVSYFQAKSPLLIDYLFYLLPLTFLVIFLTIFESYSRMHLRIVVPSAIRDLFIKIAFVGLVILVAVKFITFDSFIFFLTLSHLLALIALGFYVKYLNRLYIWPDFKYLNWDLVKDVVKYGFFVNLAGAANLIFSKIDMFILPAMTDLNKTAIYSVAISICLVIEIPRKTITQISTPILVDALNKNQMEKVKELYQKTSISMLLIGCFLYLLIWTNINEIFNLIPKSTIFSQGKYVVLIFALTKVADMATGINSEIIHQSKYYTFDIVLMLVVSISSIVANYILIPIMGINGAALAAAFSVFVYNLIKFVFIWFKFGMQPFTTKTILMIVITGTIVLINSMFFLKSFGIVGSFLIIVLRSLIISLMFLVLVLRFNISTDFTNTFRNIIQNLKIIIGR